MSEEILWHSLSVKKTLELLKTSSRGLTEAEARKRQSASRVRQLPAARKISWFKILLSQFHNALIYILIVASLISWLLDDVVDAQVILAAILIQVIMGFVQEYRANRSLEKLYSIIKPQARVIRQGREQEIDRSDVVAGDIIVLVAGDTVPADARLLSATDLQLNESILTGESLPVMKSTEPVAGGAVVADRRCMVYLSTLVVSGSGQAVVVATGIETEVGAVARLLSVTDQAKTPLQARLMRFSYQVSLVIIVVAAAIFFLGLSVPYPVSEMISLSVALAVAAIPEGLVIGVTVVLTIGMQRILRRNGLVRSLQAAETLGSTTIICSDKTGTLTVGEMRLAYAVTADGLHDLTTPGSRALGAEAKRLLTYCAINNDAVVENEHEDLHRWQLLGTPTEQALILGAGEQGLRKSLLEAEYPRLDTIPFNSDRKYMITLHADGQKQLIIAKGAPEKILAAVTAPDQEKQKWQQHYQALSRKGYRVIACAAATLNSKEKQLGSESDIMRQLKFIGFAALSDIIRPEVPATIEQASAAGIRTIMITGDNILTARAIAKQLGIPSGDGHSIEGHQLLGLTDAELRKRVKTISVYARVSPKDKLRIVQAWQSHGAVVAMTGDGINDAPALKTADIGVALGSGSDVAKETADLVLLDNNFKTIVAAVREGRVIATNISKIILFLMSGSASEVVAIVCALILFGSPSELILPLTAAQILWLNLVKDSFPQLALTMEPEEGDELQRRPVSTKQSLLPWSHWLYILVISGVTGLASLFIFRYLWLSTNDLPLAQTAAFATLGTATLAYVYSLKHAKSRLRWKTVFANRYLNIAVLFSFGLQLLAIYNPLLQRFLQTKPLSFDHWLLIVAVVIIILLCIELLKAAINRSAINRKNAA